MLTRSSAPISVDRASAPYAAALLAASIALYVLGAAPGIAWVLLVPATLREPSS